MWPEVPVPATFDSVLSAAAVPWKVNVAVLWLVAASVMRVDARGG